MAEYNDELAFLESMKGEPSYATESDNAAPAEIDAESADEDEDYDPSDFVPPATAALETEKPANTNGAQQNGGVTKQPRTRGGFVIDDDDDEEETESQDASAHGTDGLLNGAKISSELQRSSSGTPSNALSTPDANVPILKPETLPSKESIALNPSASALLSDSRANSSTPVPNASTTTPAVRPVEQPKPTSSSLPKVRLPQDRVGILEDRVKEDPRGDMEAWLELISEHRNRNRLDDARAVYDRFFKVFPSAVSSKLLIHLISLLTEYRLNNGLHTLTWNLKMKTFGALSKSSIKLYYPFRMCSSGECIWTMCVGETISPQTALARLVKSSLKRMNLSWPT
jgi:cleavage stimulation factor subunit 3